MLHLCTSFVNVMGSNILKHSILVYKFALPCPFQPCTNDVYRKLKMMIPCASDAECDQGASLRIIKLNFVTMLIPKQFHD